MSKIVGNPVGVPNPKTNWEQTDEKKADVVLNKPTKLSQFENDVPYAKQGEVDEAVVQVWSDMGNLYMQLNDKADATYVVTYMDESSFTFRFESMDNYEARLFQVCPSISFVFGNGVYSDTYTSGLSFDSGATPTAIDYTDSGIINWVGTDCTTSDGLSIFQPSANTHYDIVFYFNGTQFIGLVNGFVPATGNEAV